MKSSVPVKGLVRLSWIMAIVISGFVGLFVFTLMGINGRTLFTVLQGAVDFLVISFFHIFVLVRLRKYARRLPAIKQRLARYAVTYTITLVYKFGTSPLNSIIDHTTWQKYTRGQHVVIILASAVLLNTFILVMHNLVIVYEAHNMAVTENARLKVANAEANNQLLKQQIHPHFLFNALNILKTLYKKDAAAGDTYIVHLANFLRAAISNTSAKLVTLADEIKICTDYIAMQKIRFGDALQCHIDLTPTDTREDFIPSFSLQPLLENAIKHNDVTDERPLTISVFKQGGYVVVENNLQRKKQPVASTGNGLVNLMKRYQLISGDEVIIREEGQVFSVRLKLLKA